jgi:hypothetical protein
MWASHHPSRLQELTQAEKVRLLHWIDWCPNRLDGTLDPRPDLARCGRQYQTLFARGKDTSNGQNVGAILDTASGRGI